MDEKKGSVQQDEYQVIQEKIVPKKNKARWVRLGKTLIRTIIHAALFGVIAAIVLVFSGKFFVEKLGLENALRQIVEIGGTTPTPKAAPTKAPTPTPKNTSSTTPTKVPEPSPSEPAQVTPDIPPEITVTIGEGSSKNPVDSTKQTETIQDFLNIYSGVTGLARELEKSLVKITAITEGVDWFEEAYETRENATGLYVGDNGLSMLFLVNLDSIEGATKFEVTFANGKSLPGTIFSYDTNYRLAVLSVRMSAAASMEKEVLPERARFALDNVEAGIPVMVLGNPNGHVGAMELGMTTGVNQVVPVIDDEVLYFTTGITKYADGDGFVFNLSGEVIGITSDKLNNGENGVFTAAMVSGMRQIIEKTLNNMPRIYCGMRLETVDEVMREKNNLPEGVYVTEVLPSSPAMSAGIKNGDIIIQVGIEPATDVRQFHEGVSSSGAGRSIRVTVNREVKGERKDQTFYLVPEERMH